MTLTAFFLYIFGVAAIIGGLGMLLQRNPIMASLSLAVTFLSLAGMFAALDAHFLAVIQIIVYAGLIQVLIIYTIMLMDLDEADLRRKMNFARILGAIVGVVFVVQVVYVVMKDYITPSPEAAPEGFGTAAAVAQTLYGKYLLPFEIVSVLLLTGIVGAVLLAQQQKRTKGKTDLSKTPTPLDTESSVNPQIIKR